MTHLSIDMYMPDVVPFPSIKIPAMLPVPSKQCAATIYALRKRCISAITINVLGYMNGENVIRIFKEMEPFRTANFNAA